MDERTISAAILLLIKDKHLSKKFVFENIMSKQGFAKFALGGTRTSFFLISKILTRMHVSLGEFEDILNYCGRSTSSSTCIHEDEFVNNITKRQNAQALQDHLFECFFYHQDEIHQLHCSLNILDSNFIHRTMLPTLLRELLTNNFGPRLALSVDSLVIDTLNELIQRKECVLAQQTMLNFEPSLVENFYEITTADAIKLLNVLNKLFL